MKLANIIEGMQIIAKYTKNEYCVHAEHDQMWCGEYDLPLSEEDSNHMNRLGWFKSDEGWSCFT